MNPEAATLRVAVPPRAGILIDIVLLTARPSYGATPPPHPPTSGHRPARGNTIADYDHVVAYGDPRIGPRARPHR